MARLLPGGVLVLLLLPGASGANFRWSARPSVVTTTYYVPAVAVAYYYPVPICMAPPAPIRGPVVAPAVRTYAQPTPAPPSTTPEPPLVPRPAVSESRFYDVFAVAPGDRTRPAADRCSVAFWNLSGQDLTLTVAGQKQTIVRGKSLTLELDRQFVWQVEGRESQAERVPATESGLEIVIRR